MKRGWTTRPFEDCITTVEYTRKIQRKNFLEEGEFPIVSQEAEFTNGYWNDSSDVFHVKTPVIIFGDHTQVLKYVDFDFVLGADGVKILRPQAFLEPRFFYYQLQAAELPSLGYARHYRQLKELNISFPPLSEQQRIVRVLDEAFAGLATAQANAEKNLQNARALFESHLQSVFSQRGEGWVEKRLGEIFRTTTGATPPKGNASYYGDFMPFVKPPELGNCIIDSAADNLSIAGAEVARILPPNSILVSCIGNLGKIGLNTVPVAFNQQINAILPNERAVIPEIMFFQARSFAFKKQLEALASGTTVPIVNKSKFNNVRIVIPPMEEQKKIVVHLDALAAETRRLEGLYERKRAALVELKKSLLHQAFAGEL